ncbi:hypothetical protein VB716_08465 [Synechococcus sp. CCY9201]|uniref:hypothetical protein n=1 Tax=Synechococcus sp. CCY9201 TaxID=174697 RepID=UPI002B1FD0E6|nr:hypothetical protein [Synechococcus sp. CCY9201]MEA5474253.1 hypothetical protein [Synechococcus sp. CCY9201]
MLNCDPRPRHQRRFTWEQVLRASASTPFNRLRACQQRNQHLLNGVRRLRLSDIPTCFDYILWDQAAERLTTVPAPAL